MKQISVTNSTVTNYWLEFYTHDGFCSLCGNNGVIDTSGVQTPKDILVGRKNYCICPNGQMLRKVAIKQTGNRNTLP